MSLVVLSLGWLFFGVLAFIVLGVYPYRYDGDPSQMSLSWRKTNSR